EPDRRNDEQIDADDVGGVIAQESPPARRARAVTPWHVLGDSRLSDVDTKFQQLAMNAWRTPQRVVAADCPDQIADVGRDRRPTDTTARLATPVQTEAAPMPAHQRLRLIDIAQSTVAKYMSRRHGPRSPGWRAFLRNHTAHIAGVDLFVVPTIGFKLLYGLVILRLERRRLVWTGVTANPTAEWIARQITEAFPWDEAPRYLIRDRDTSYGAAVTRRLRAMGIRDRPITPRSPWQNGHVERLIGSIRRECLDHVVVLGERHLRHLLAN